MSASEQHEPARLATRAGVLLIDGRPRLLVAADHPYYRDDPDNWQPRLEAMREAGIETVTAYIPWRHHAPQDILQEPPDFSGRTQPARDLRRFVKLAAQEGLSVILKPGPFVHGELPFGGLPDYVDAARVPAIEPERDAEGAPIRWVIGRTGKREDRILPAPLGRVYMAYTRAWLHAVAREVAPLIHPAGPVIGIQLMNEGIYSDSARADPLQLGFATSSVEHFHAFLAEKYERLSDYGRIHGTHHRAWAEIDPPRRVSTLETMRSLLAYLDWSEYQSRLYRDVARIYKTMLVEGGLPPDVPIFLNFNANGSTFRDRPASNDGWYTRVATLAKHEDFTFGTTNWLGVTAGDPAAFRQYLMAATLTRGPALELNWGFSSQYYAPYELESPSHFETMLAVAAGATGIVAYTFAGTRAWRASPNLDDGAVPPRTNDHGDETSGDYPGDSPVQSNGVLSSKYWTLAQIAHYLRSASPRFVVAGPRARVAWAFYPPYAWAGQWLGRGDPDDVMWRPPLRVVPRGAYHGLDAFVEMMLWRGGAFSQIDISRESPDPLRERVVCMSSHESMDRAAQQRLATYVEAGGHLLLTGAAPRVDERNEVCEAALGPVFPHEDLEDMTLGEPHAIEGLDGVTAVAMEFATLVKPPADAVVIATLDGQPVGYTRRVGRGTAAYLGFAPWRARWSNDDRHVAKKNQAFVWGVLERIAGPDLLGARPSGGDGEVSVWQHGAPDASTQDVFVCVRERTGDTAIEFLQADGTRARAILRSPSQSMHAFAAGPEGPLACYLKGVNDLRAESVPPRLEIAGAVWETDVPCDLCVTPSQRGLRVSVAHVRHADRARVRLDIGGRRIEVEVQDMKLDRRARHVDVDLDRPQVADARSSDLSKAMTARSAGRSITRERPVRRLALAARGGPPRRSS